LSIVNVNARALAVLRGGRMVAEDALARVEMSCAHQVVDVVLEINLVRIR
jgi:ABC-type antimicrobial peptide transport system ATPase subunit